MHKKKSRAVLNNYKPVALFSVITNIKEKIINDQIMKFLGKEQLLLKHQFGFHRGMGQQIC